MGGEMVMRTVGIDSSEKILLQSHRLDCFPSTQASPGNQKGRVQTQHPAGESEYRVDRRNSQGGATKSNDGGSEETKEETAQSASSFHF